MTCCVLIDACVYKHHHGLLEDSVRNGMWHSSFSFSSLHQLISSGDKACSSSRLECTAESASIDCNEEPDLANLNDEVVVSRSKVSTSYYNVF